MYVHSIHNLQYMGWFQCVVSCAASPHFLRYLLKGLAAELSLAKMQPIRPKMPVKVHSRQIDKSAHCLLPLRPPQKLFINHVVFFFVRLKSSHIFAHYNIIGPIRIVSIWGKLFSSMVCWISCDIVDASRVFIINQAFRWLTPVLRFVAFFSTSFAKFEVVCASFNSNCSISSIIGLQIILGRNLVHVLALMSSSRTQGPLPAYFLWFSR